MSGGDSGNRRRDGRRLILGTRGSDLALAQAVETRDALERLGGGLEVGIKIIRTTGDRRLDVSLKAPQRAGGVGKVPKLDKGLFTKELETALAAGEIDVAVHSLKDLPTTLPPGLELAAVLRRAPVEDVILIRDEIPVGHGDGGWRDLPEGARVATGSVRRERFLRYLRPDMRFCDIRGNVPTRIQRLLEAGENGDDLDAVVLARAGLQRLGFVDAAGRWNNAGDAAKLHGIAGKAVTCVVLDVMEFPPAVGQGAIGLEIREHDGVVLGVLEQVRDEITWACVRAERALLRELGGGCQTPLGAVSRVKGGVLELEGRIFCDDEGEGEGGPRVAMARGSMADAGLVGAKVAAMLRRA